MRFTVPSTRTRPTKRSLQKGQAIVLVGLLILVLFGMLGLAIDSGRAYVDRRDQQAAVDAAALAAGGWYMNYFACSTPPAPVGPTANLRQATSTYTYSAGYTLQLVATNTQFNGYQFVFTSSH